MELKEKIPESYITLKSKRQVNPDKRFKIKRSRDIFKVARAMFESDTIEWTEEIIMFCLNRANHIINFNKISNGGTAGSVLDLKVVFSIALTKNANSIIICHNHPSGNLNPSENDKQITRKLKNAAKLLDMELIDHIIISKWNYYSFADNGEI